MTDPTSLPNFTPPPLPTGTGTGGGSVTPPPEAPLKERVRDALIDLGIEARIDDDGDVAFTIEEQQLFVRCAEDASNVLRLFGQWSLEEPVPADPLTRLQVTNDLNVAFNLVKAAVAGDTLLITSEHILPRGADVRGLIGLAVPLVLQGVQLWHQRATGQTPEDAAQQAQAAEQAEGNPS